MTKYQRLSVINGMSEDEQHLWADELQKLTDKHIEKIDQTLATKEEEITQV